MNERTIDRRSVLKASGALAGAAALGLLGGGSVAAESHIETTSGETEPEYELGDAEEFYVDVEIQNADGDDEEPTLYGEIIRPVDDDGETVDDVPVILTYSPYNDLYQALNGGDSPARDGIAEFFVPRGYARAQFDLIGTRNSGGYYDYGGIRERLSGAELVDALGGMEWSNGNIGMIGGSYDGTTQIAAAIEAPDHLEAVIPQVAIDRWYDYRYHGGCPWTTWGTPTLFDFGFAAVPPATVDEPEAFADATATRLEPGSRVEHEVRSYEYNSDYDEFWEERDYRRRAENVDCAVMMEGGWEDRNVRRWGTTRFFEALEGVDKRLVMGDWAHSSGQYHDIQDLYHAWFDQWLVEDVDDTGVMDLPPVDVESESAPRTQYEEWPPAESDTLAFPFVDHDADQCELELVGTGNPTWEDRSPPIEEDEMFEERGSGERYLMFETPRLDDEIHFTGHVTADLLAASDGDTWFTAVVYERYGDGDVRIFARGFQNSLYLNGLEEQESTPDDRSYRAPVHCWDINWTVSEGSRLGVVIASDNDDWVRHDPRNEGTNSLQFTESHLRFDGLAECAEGAALPDATLSRDSDASVYTAGQTARITATVDSASDEVFLRDRLPEGWDVYPHDGYSTTEIDGATYVESDEPVEPGESFEYLARVPGDTGEHSFGPLEYSGSGELWATAGGTTEEVYVVGIGT